MEVVGTPRDIFTQNAAEGPQRGREASAHLLITGRRRTFIIGFTFEFNTPGETSGGGGIEVVTQHTKNKRSDKRRRDKEHKGMMGHQDKYLDFFLGGGVSKNSIQ